MLLLLLGSELNLLQLNLKLLSLGRCLSEDWLLWLRLKYGGPHVLLELSGIGCNKRFAICSLQENSRFGNGAVG
jgi:hypothetical protein